MSICRYVCPPLSTLPLCIPRYYGGVVLVGVGAMATNMYFASRVMKARKEHNYPLLYHPTNNLFNCIQRGHQNYLEVLPLFMMFLFVGGLRYPVTCGSIFLIGRILYFKGYATGDPKKRKMGSVSMIGLLPMVLGTLAFGVQHLMASTKCSSCSVSP
ncbi:Microsomal glutathione s-transferase [Paragonimus heterotremus]|uniref:Microsomal glutathione s-transferase n=1 Tax=Paragonimus heterotremus TaxID=100268 RepID=A0A8J4WIP0_9TREM|nr:Microsomal glutathione s-transferase [Paragonimus heterotremus]